MDLQRLRSPEDLHDPVKAVADGLALRKPVPGGNGVLFHDGTPGPLDGLLIGAAGRPDIAITRIPNAVSYRMVA